MNEEDIISILEDMLEKAGKLYEEEFYTLVEDKHMWAVRGLLDLYNQEKEENRKKNIVIIEYQDLLEREEEKNKKLEEVIDMMATFIGNEDIDEEICKNVDECYRENEDGDYFPCKACVKEYYFKVAKGEEYKNKYCGGED